MALALYRTYRPGTLAEVIGQEHVTGPLARALDSGRVHHAYLFSGPRGCGKTSTARILARSLNCVNGPTSTPCGTCRSCVELAPNGPGSVDVVELDAATHRSVEDARELRERAVYAPAADRYRIYIIDEAHQLTSDAANALLKVIEEPPPHLRFVFATTEPDKIIPTIRSRTFHYGFRLVPTRVLVEHLAAVCAAEDVAAEPAALSVVARAGAGSVRDSLSVLGQLLAGSGPAGLTHSDAVAALGLTGSVVVDDFVAALAGADAARMFVLVDRVVTAGHDPRRFVADLLERLRDLMVIRVDPDAVDTGAVDVPADAVPALQSQAQSLGLAEMSRAADLVSAGLTEIRGATAPRLQLELLCARLALAGQHHDLTSLAARVDRLERGAAPRASSAAPETPTGSTEPATAPAPAAGQAREADTGSGGAPTSTGGDAGRAAVPPAPQGRRDDRTAARSAGNAGPERAGTADPTRPPPRPRLSGPSEPPRRPAPSRSESLPAAGPPARAVEPRAPAANGDEGSADLGRIQQSWDTVLGRLGSKSRVAWATFSPSAPLSVRDGALAVAVADVGSLNAIGQRGFDELLRQALIEVLGLDVTIDAVLDPDAARGGASTSAAAGTTSGAASAGRGTAGGGAAPASRGRSAPPDEQHPAQQGPPAAAPGPSRAAEVIRGAGAQADRADGDDEPSPDDPDLAAGDGLALITRELGAKPIGEIDHT